MKHIYLLVALACPTQVFANPAVIENVNAQGNGGSWSFSVTIRHPDTGWDHYADGWEVIAPDGTQLGYRKLLHPHESEHPFTRSLGGINIPDGVSSISVRAHCSVDGWTSEPVSVPIR